MMLGPWSGVSLFLCWGRCEVRKACGFAGGRQTLGDGISGLTEHEPELLQLAGLG